MARRTTWPDVHELDAALASPLRLRLLTDLLEAEEERIPAQEAVRRTGRHPHDIAACLQPLVGWGLVERLPGEQGWRLARAVPDELRARVRRLVQAGEEHVARDRRVSGQVLCGMIGVDPKMLVVFEMIQQVARLDVPVLVTGETGTGKELVARAIHELSPAHEFTFGAVNCATLSDELFASEMFGHVKGAFTGAHRDHKGLIERCHRGTLFLDEVADLSAGNQVKLLRVLQERTFTRVGDERVRRSEFRIICATNRDLEAMVGGGEFREDLYYRLNVFPLRVPSLRERPDDLPHLARELLRGKLRHLHEGEGEPALGDAALARLLRHPWPGNVRELENVLMRALIVSRGLSISLDHLPPLGGPGRGRANTTPHPGTLEPLSTVERRHIRRVVRALAGNVSASAAALGISRTTLYKKLRAYGIDPAELAGER